MILDYWWNIGGIFWGIGGTGGILVEYWCNIGGTWWNTGGILVKIGGILVES